MATPTFPAPPGLPERLRWPCRHEIPAASAIDGSNDPPLFSNGAWHALEAVYSRIADRRASGDTTPAVVDLPGTQGHPYYLAEPIWWDLSYTTLRGTNPRGHIKAGWRNHGPLLLLGFERAQAGPTGALGRPRADGWLDASAGTRYAIRTGASRHAIFPGSPPTTAPGNWRDVRLVTVTAAFREPDGAPLRPGPLCGLSEMFGSAHPWLCEVQADGKIRVRFSTHHGVPPVTWSGDGRTLDRSFAFSAPQSADGTVRFAFTIDLENARVLAWAGSEQQATVDDLGADFAESADLIFTPNESAIFAVGSYCEYGIAPTGWGRNPRGVPPANGTYGADRICCGLHVSFDQPYSTDGPGTPWQGPTGASNDLGRLFTPRPGRGTWCYLPLDDNPATQLHEGRTILVRIEADYFARSYGIFNQVEPQNGSFRQQGLRLESLTLESPTFPAGTPLLGAAYLQDPRFSDCDFRGGHRGAVFHFAIGGSHIYTFERCSGRDSSDCWLYAQKLIAEVFDYRGGAGMVHWIRADDTSLTAIQAEIKGMGPTGESIVKSTPYDYGGTIHVERLMQDSEGDGGPRESAIHAEAGPWTVCGVYARHLSVGTMAPDAVLLRLLAPEGRSGLHLVDAEWIRCWEGDSLQPAAYVGLTGVGSGVWQSVGGRPILAVPSNAALAGPAGLVADEGVTPGVTVTVAGS